MRIIKIATLALALVTPIKVSAADLALLIAKFDGESYSNQRAVERELASVEQAYRNAGFTLTSLRDLNPPALRIAITDFEAASRGADRLVVHYMGGVLVNTSGLRLTPTGYTPGGVTDQAYESPSLHLIYQLLAQRPGQNAMVLAGTNPDMPGLVSSGPTIPNGTLVLTGSPLEVNRAVRDGMMAGESGFELDRRNGVSAFGFVSGLAMAPVPQPQIAAAQPTAAERGVREMRAWRRAAQDGTRQSIQGYLDAYPNGLFRGEALARLNALTPPKSVEETTEENLALSRADRRRIQRNLTLLGFDTRGVDGLFGRGSRAAIENWQRSEGFRASGFLDAAQIRVLDETARVKEEADRSARERDDVAYWQQTGSGSTEQGLREYLTRYPDGLFSTQAKQALARVQQDNQGQQNQAFLQRENALNMNGQTRALVEQRLAGLGYNVGPADGNFTNETRVAIREFQEKSGLNATGYMDNQTVTRLVASIFR